MANYVTISFGHRSLVELLDILLSGGTGATGIMRWSCGILESPRKWSIPEVIHIAAHTAFHRH